MSIYIYPLLCVPYDVAVVGWLITRVYCDETAGYRVGLGKCHIVHETACAETTVVYYCEPVILGLEQELSYRKQIARQLRTQYVVGINRPNYPVTLKSRLRVTQGHWKQKHWINHTRLAISRDI